jgi:internalin A
LIDRSNAMRFYLAKNPFDNLPSEIANLDNCLEDARAWYYDLDKESVENYDVKLMLVGNGRVGKTSVLKQLFYNKFDPEESSTHGIQLYETNWNIEGFSEPLRINAWDFGGQEIYHATHRLFMQSRALYLALWDAVTEKEPFAVEQIAGQTVHFRNFELNYWLDHARSLSWRSPLLVVQNKMDVHGRQWPTHFEKLQKRYEVTNFFQLSAANGEGVSVLKAALLEEFKKMPEVGMEMPGQWHRIKTKLLDLKKENKTISFQSYQELCEEEGLNTSSTQALIRFLHNTGNLFYQSHIYQNRIILDQEWALDGMYALFQRGPFFKQLEYSGGRTSLSILEWPWQKYDLDTRKIFLSIMENCEICFQITESHIDPEYVITEFLSKERDAKVTNFWDEIAPGELFLRYQTLFFHSAFITRFITRAGRLAENFDHMWRSGIWITYQNAHALIEAFPEEHQIMIRVKGEPGRLLLFLIHQAFKEIFYDSDTVEMEIFTSDQKIVSYREIKDGKKRGAQKVITKSKQLVDLEEVAFFTEVLEAESENEVKREYLVDIVPKPPVKESERVDDGQIDETILQNLKAKLKKEIGKGLGQALEQACLVVVDCSLKDELITVQSRYADLMKHYSSGRLKFDEYDQHSNQMRSGLMGIIDRIEKEDLDLNAVFTFI